MEIKYLQAFPLIARQPAVRPFLLIVYDFVTSRPVLSPPTLHSFRSVLRWPSISVTLSSNRSARKRFFSPFVSFIVLTSGSRGSSAGTLWCLFPVPKSPSFCRLLSAFAALPSSARRGPGLPAMGAYLSQPSTAKSSGDGVGIGPRPLHFGYSAMQGWRVSMEVRAGRTEGGRTVSCWVILPYGRPRPRFLWRLSVGKAF